jgi:hypothetical protein
MMTSWSVVALQIVKEGFAPSLVDDAVGISFQHVSIAPFDRKVKVKY